MILYRCFAWNRAGGDEDPGGPLWFPRALQGEGRHDNPNVYGCLYVADRAVSCVVERLAPFRGQRLRPEVLQRGGLPLALALLRLDERAPLVDLDEPSTLRREKLRPSRVATRDRRVTQPQALALHRRHPDAAGLAWWSTWEALWVNVTLFDRAAASLELVDVRALSADDPAVIEAADRFGLLSP